MPTSTLIRRAGGAAFAALLSLPVFADTYSVDYSTLVASTTFGTPFVAGDNLFADTFTTEQGALNQSTTFTLASAVDFNGIAAWAIDTATGQGPRLVGVNIDIVDSTATVVASDTFTGVLGGFAHSSFLGSLGPGTYTLIATGNAVRDASLDISLSFTQAVPEPATYGMMMGGLAVLAMLARRRR